MPGRWLGPPWLWSIVGLALTFGAFLFAWTAATFPGEWQEELLPSWRVLPAMDEWGPATEMDANGNPRIASLRDWIVNAKRVSLHDWLFNAEPDQITRRRLPFSSTLVLPGLNVYEGLGIDDPERIKGTRLRLPRARPRSEGAMLDFASLPRVDFTGAIWRARPSLGRSLIACRLKVHTFMARGSMGRSFRARRSKTLTFRT